MREDQLSPQEKRLFHELSRGKEPPGYLEDQIINQLISQGQIKKQNKMKNLVTWTSAIAASVLLFITGYYVGQNNQELPVTINPTSGYMLLLHEDDEFQPGDPMEMFEEYSAWMENTFASGVKITGQELKNEALLVNGNEVVELNNSAERRTTGYFILEAATLEDAIAVAKANPHVKYGGTVEVKPYMVR